MPKIIPPAKEQPVDNQGVDGGQMIGANEERAVADLFQQNFRLPANTDDFRASVAPYELHQNEGAIDKPEGIGPTGPSLKPQEKSIGARQRRRHDSVFETIDKLDAIADRFHFICIFVGNR